MKPCFGGLAVYDETTYSGVFQYYLCHFLLFFIAFMLLVSFGEGREEELPFPLGVPAQIYAYLAERFLSDETFREY